MTDLYDEGEADADGDIAPEDIDWNAVSELEARQAEVLALPEGEERSTAMLGLLHELHGDDLEVL